MNRFSLLPLCLPLVACQSESEPFARAYQIEDLSQAIGGPKASAQPGDFLLENDRIRVAILGARNSYGPGIYGGSIIDVDLQRDDPRYAQGQGNDIFAEMFPTANMNVIKADEEDGEVSIVEDHDYGKAAVVRVTGPSAGFLTLLDAMWNLIGAPSFELATDYVLEPGADHLRIITTVTYGGGEIQASGEPLPALTSQDPLLEYAIENGLVIGDFYLGGGSLDVFAPDIGFDEGKAVEDAWNSGRNLFLEPFEVEFLASTGDGTSYGYASLDGPLQIPMFTSNQTAGVAHGIQGDDSLGGDRFPDGTAWSSERILAVGEGDVGSVLDTILQVQGVPTGRVEGFVLETGTLEPVSDAHVFAYRGAGDDRAAYPYAEWRTDVGRDVRDDGSFGGRLPVGSWTLFAHQKGRADGDSVVVEVTEGQRYQVALGLPMSGWVEVQVVDDQGRDIPAKVTIFPEEGVESTRNSILGDGYMAGGNVDMLLSDGEPVQTMLPTGNYYAVASRGPEYEIATSPTFLVSDHETTRIELQVARVVDTSGWIAADFHVHGDTSFDSGTGRELRLASMAAEGVEFFPSTDHDYLTDYDVELEAMGLEPWLRSEVGVEVSPLEMGHFIGWPMDHDTLLECGGAFEWTGMEPEDLFDELYATAPADRDPVSLVAHPRDGILGYFDQFGLNPYESSDGDIKLETPMLSLVNPLLTAENFTLEFTALELFNSFRMELLRSPTQQEADDYAAGMDVSVYDFMARTMEEQEALEGGDTTLAYNIKGQVDDWFTLLNLGYRLTAVGSSDSHYPSSVPSGSPRNYVLSETDSPAYIDPAAVDAAVHAHQVVASYGPFIRFEADGQPIGSELAASGSVTLSVEVQSPSWFDVDRVELYENGSLIQEWTVATPNSGVVNLSETLSVEPEQDAWYVVVALGDDDLEPVVPGLERQYFQFQDIVVEALGSMPSLSAFLSDAIPRPRSYPIHPYALTNPIWIDAEGDGWDPPGLPLWLEEPAEPGSEKKG